MNMKNHRIKITLGDFSVVLPQNKYHEFVQELYDLVVQYSGEGEYVDEDGILFGWEVQGR
jgi:hypothetical protein